MKKAIKTRRSIRTYKPVPLLADHLKKIKAYLKDDTNLIGPFSNKIQLRLVETKGGLSNGKIGTYGVIKHAPLYLISSCINNKESILDCGYVLEKLILYLESLGIGTCWLGGTFSRKNLGLDTELSSTEIIPAITPVGYKESKDSITGKIFQHMAKSNTRKPFDELFFQDNFNTAITDTDKRKLLEFIRIGPSASNKQPWRIVLSEDVAHFYIERTPKYVGNKFGYDMQLLDIGIALAHYEIAANKKLYIIQSKPNIDMPNEMYEYIGSVK